MSPKKRPASANSGKTLALVPAASPPKAKAKTSNEAMDPEEKKSEDILSAESENEEAKAGDNSEEQEEEPEESAPSAKSKAKKTKTKQKKVKKEKEKKKPVQRKMKRPAAATGDEEKDKKESLFAKTEKWKQVGTKGTKQPCPSSSEKAERQSQEVQENGRCRCHSRPHLGDV